MSIRFTCVMQVGEQNCSLARFRLPILSAPEESCKRFFSPCRLHGLKIQLAGGEPGRNAAANPRDDPGAFFRVKGAGRFSEAKALIAETNFDLVVLCHSLSIEDCEALANLAHEQKPRPLVLAMSADGNSKGKPWADKQLGVDGVDGVDDEPYDGLLKKCSAMLGYVLKNKAKTAQEFSQHDASKK